MKHHVRCVGTSLVEMMIAVAVSSVVIGALLTSSMSIQKAIHGSEVFANSYSDQRRVTDYIARELRRAVAVEVAGPSGARSPLGTDPVTITDTAALVFTVPGYYKSNDPASGDYAASMAVIETDDHLDYGDDSGFAPTVEVSFRKEYVADEGCICFVRQEAGIDEVIVLNADTLSVQASISNDLRSGKIKTWFPATFSSAGPWVSTFDEVLLRNSPPYFEP